MQNTPTSGHATGLPIVTRRALLLSAPALAAAPLTLEAATAPADPLPGLLALCEQRRLEWLATAEIHGEDSPEDKAAWEAFRAAEDIIEGTKATTPAGIAAQLEYAKASYGSGLSPEDDPRRSSDIPHAFLNHIIASLKEMGQ